MAKAKVSPFENQQGRIQAVCDRLADSPTTSTDLGPAVVVAATALNEIIEELREISKTLK